MMDVVSAFKSNQLFNFLSDSLNTDNAFIISKNIKTFHEMLREFFIIWTVWYIC